MRKTYTTISGDMWDGIAYKTLGSEMYTDALIRNNIEHRNTVIFSAGVILEIPEAAVKPESGLPPWKREGVIYE
jgi:hypothetical protein